MVTGGVGKEGAGRARRLNSTLPALWVRLLLVLLLVGSFLLVDGFALPGGGKRVFDVTEFGAAGDTQTLDTHPIQEAIDTCAQAGGGTVYFPPGVYLAGTLLLRSNLTLYLERGATLLQSKRMEDYLEAAPASYVHHTASHYAFLSGTAVRNVAIRGGGVIDGNLAFDFENASRRGPLSVFFEDSEDILIEDISVVRSPSWDITFSGCREISVFRVKSLHSFATGINFTSCQDAVCDSVLIDGSQDDPLTIKNDSVGYSYATRPKTGFVTKNVVIRNTTVRNSHHGAVKLGTGTFGVFQNIVVSDCNFENLDDMFRIMLYRPKLKETPRRAIENIIFSNITLKNVGKLLNWGTAGADTPVIRNITIENVIADGTDSPSMMMGLPAAPIREIRLSNLQIHHRKKRSADPHWLEAGYVEGLSLENVRLHLADSVESFLLLEEGKDLGLANVVVAGLAGERPVMRLKQLQGAFIQGCRVPERQTFIQAVGKKTSQIRLLGNDLRQVQVPLEVTDEIPEGSIWPVAGPVEYRDLRVSEKIGADERFIARVRVSNPGRAGAVKSLLWVNGKTDGGKWMWLGEGETGSLRLESSRYYEAGSYRIQVGGVSAQAEVESTGAKIGVLGPLKVTPPARGKGATRIEVQLKNRGGMEGTHEVKLSVGGEVVQRKPVSLGPGEIEEVFFEQDFGELPCREFQIDQEPAWPFAVSSNAGASFSGNPQGWVIEAESRAGVEARSVSYRDEVAGDFIATVKVIGQEVMRGYGYPLSGLLVSNHLGSSEETGGSVALYTTPVPPFGFVSSRGDFDGDGQLDNGCGTARFYRYPLWLKLEKRDRIFSGYGSQDGRLWHQTHNCWGDRSRTREGVYAIPSAGKLQDVGVYADTQVGSREIDPTSGSTKPGELGRERFEFADFRLEEPVPEEAIRYRDLKISTEQPDLDETFTVSARLINGSSQAGAVKAGLYVDGHETFSQWLSLRAGEHRTVEFDLTLRQINDKGFILHELVGPTYWSQPHEITIGNRSRTAPSIRLAVLENDS